MEGPAAGVRGLPRWQRHLKEPLALDSQVKRVAGLTEVALALHNLRSRGACSQPYLKTSCDRGLLGRCRTRHDHVLVNQIFKLQPPLAKPGGARVGQIVGHVLQIHFLRTHPAGAGVQGSQHMASSFQSQRFWFRSLTLSAIHPPRGG